MNSELAGIHQIAQFGSDLAWKTILSSVVEVEGVGQVGVARVLQEIWKRGGGDMVTNQSLWSTVIISLSLPTEDHSVGQRIQTPSPHAATALQNLYNLTLKHWEPAIFSGLLAGYTKPDEPVQLPTPETDRPTPPTLRPKFLQLPTDAFVPPPPMCMFFSPSFHDLSTNKVGIWKGDLDMQGRGGGRFSVLIVGETCSGDVWQSHLWPKTITYPPVPQPNQSCTATMIPVAHLAREGYSPSAMGMVLCNGDNINEYVAMVQGLHAEGVAFHLPTADRMPIVFLPAKFDVNDKLQRLGIAFMSKPGTEPIKKKRRQSAPAQALPTIPRRKQELEEVIE